MSDFSYNGVLIGDCGVGKTSILERLINDTFNESIQSTTGVSTREYELNYNGMNYQLHINDIVGQLNYANIMPIYFKNSNFAIAVFDLTEKSTLDHLDDWITHFKEYANEFNDVIIVGNKSDKPNLLSEDQVREKIEIMGIDYEYRYVSISTKNGTNFSSLLSLLGYIIDNIKDEEKARQQPDQYNIVNPPAVNKCCKS